MTDPITTPPATRPTLLTVICIISFIMGAWGVFSGYRNTVMDGAKVLEEARTTMEKAKADLGEQAEGLAGRIMDESMVLTERSVANAKSIGIADILISLLSLFGVWQMWNLRKNGFWFYLLATVLGLGAPLYFLGGSWMALASVGFVGFFSIIFVILYAVNLKHMH